ncbi:sec14 cytosolic factor-like [Vicia villosa]|uniref:sec14 cytosolic factor-like n=1 Tax=Vicia villosa TaxID=3911 RepID=UPI00273C701A|nr:sec14 cytosolic factor-like [Vicia villosa]
MAEETNITLTQLKNSIAKHGSSTRGYGDPTLMRFLIAQSMEPDKAAKMFVQWQKWRDTMVPNGFISNFEVPRELETRKIFLQGLSQDKYPLMIVQACRHFPFKDQIQFKKFIIHIFDKTIASASKGHEVGNEKFIIILDLHNISYKNVDSRGLITGFQFLQSYYPERLAKFYILHMPWFFVSVWRLVSGFLDKATKEKIVIIRNESERKKFIDEVGEEILPEECGGRAKLVAIQDFEVMIPHENGRTN